MRRWFPSFDGSARVSPYLYVAPKRRWWPTLVTFAAGGMCVLALMGPSQKASVEKTQRPLVFQVRPGDAVAAKDLVSPPPATAAEGGRDVHQNSGTPAAKSVTPEPAPVPQRPNLRSPASVMASMEAANAGVPPETAMKARPPRPTVFAKRHPRDRRSADLVSPPPAAAAESGRDVHQNSATPAAETVTPEPAPVPQRPNRGTPASAMASAEAANPDARPETEMKARPTRPMDFAKHHARDRRPAKSYASAPTRHRLAKKSRPAPSEEYVYDYSRNRGYRFAGERAYGSYFDGASGYYGQRGGWFAGVN